MLTWVQDWFVLTHIKKVARGAAFLYLSLCLLSGPSWRVGRWAVSRTGETRRSHFLPSCGLLFILVTGRVPRTRTQARHTPRGSWGIVGAYCKRSFHVCRRLRLAERMLTTVLLMQLHCVPVSGHVLTTLRSVRSWSWERALSAMMSILPAGDGRRCEGSC